MSQVPGAEAHARRKPDVDVNRELCSALAEIIAKLPIPADAEDVEDRIDPKDTDRFFFLLVAICHQTSPIGAPVLRGEVFGHESVGWDYLVEKFALAVHEDASLLLPERWRSFAASDLRGIYKDAKHGDTLTEVERRAELIRNLGDVMLSRHWNGPDDFYRACNGILGGTKGLLKLLTSFGAFRDPVRKKAFLFLSIMRRIRGWKYLDDCELHAPIDYHEIRGHLRLGTVRVNSKSLDRKLREQIVVSGAEDNRIRSAVGGAIQIIAKESGVQESSLHYFFWNIFRAACKRVNTACFSSFDLPKQYQFLRHGGMIDQCPFASKCRSAGKGPKYIEQAVDTDFY